MLRRYLPPPCSVPAAHHPLDLHEGATVASFHARGSPSPFSIVVACQPLSDAPPAVCRRPRSPPPASLVIVDPTAMDLAVAGLVAADPAVAGPAEADPPATESLATASCSSRLVRWERGEEKRWEISGEEIMRRGSKRLWVDKDEKIFLKCWERNEEVTQNFGRFLGGLPVKIYFLVRLLKRFACKNKLIFA